MTLVKNAVANVFPANGSNPFSIAAGTPDLNISKIKTITTPKNPHITALNKNPFRIFHSLVTSL